VDRIVQGNRDVWLIETERGATSRFTTDAAMDAHPTWSPDGSKIFFGTTRKGTWDIYQKASSGASNDEPLLVSSLAKAPWDVSPDGRFLLFFQLDPKTGHDLWAQQLLDGNKPIPVANTSFSEVIGQFSPNGRWVAYMSDETGRYEVYVQPFPDPGDRCMVSTGGGITPRWRHDGKELFYISPDEKLMAAPIQSLDQTPKAGVPVALFQTRIVRVGTSARQQYAVSLDDQRFLINTIADESTASHITIVTNWNRALEK
jgi:Tol biopolymer transport system component